VIISHKIVAVHSYDGHSEAIVEEVVECIKDICRQCSLVITGANNRNIGLFLGTTFSNFDLRFNNFELFRQKGLKAMNPAYAPKGLLSYIGGQICIACNIKGCQSTVSSGSSSGFDSLFQALHFLKRDRENKAIIIEFKENFTVEPSCAINGNCCLVLANQDNGQGLAIRAISSFFEKEHEVKAAIKAVQQALFEALLDASRLDYCFLTTSDRLDAHIKDIKDCLGSFRGEFIVHGAAYTESDTGIALIDKVFKHKKDRTGIIVNVGRNTNSSCVAIEGKSRRSSEQKRANTR